MLAIQDAIPGTCSANTNPAAVSLSPRARAAAAAEAAEGGGGARGVRRIYSQVDFEPRQLGRLFFIYVFFNII